MTVKLPASDARMRGFPPMDSTHIGGFTPSRSARLSKNLPVRGPCGGRLMA
jgi:hypothetical protein